MGVVKASGDERVAAKASGSIRLRGWGPRKRNLPRLEQNGCSRRQRPSRFGHGEGALDARPAVAARVDEYEVPPVGAQPLVDEAEHDHLAPPTILVLLDE